MSVIQMGMLRWGSLVAFFASASTSSLRGRPQ
jgi:hypothetical protein